MKMNSSCDTFDCKKIENSINNIFDIKTLPNFDNNLLEVSNIIRKELIDNYITLTDNSLYLLNLSCDSDLSKPVTLYNLFYYLEIYFKTLLLTKFLLDFNSVDNYGHDIMRMIHFIKSNTRINFDGFVYLIRKFVDKQNNSIDCSKYYHFKYNKKLNSEELIFDLKLTDNDKKNIEEVIDWLNYHMQIL